MKLNQRPMTSLNKFLVNWTFAEEPHAPEADSNLDSAKAKKSRWTTNNSGQTSEVDFNPDELTVLSETQNANSAGLLCSARREHGASATEIVALQDNAINESL